MKTSNQAEQRRHSRAELNRSLACSIQLGTDIRLGLLTNISKDGLSFRYINQDYARISAGTLCQLILLDCSGNTLVDEIGARVVYDNSSNEDYSYSLLIMRKIGIEFNELPKDNGKKLDLLLSSFSPQTKNRSQIYLSDALDLDWVKF